MSVWVFVIFLGCRFSLTTPMQSNCPCKCELKAVCPHAPATLTVPCPEMAGEDVIFSLLKDEQVIYYRKCNSTGDTLDCESNPSAGVVLREANESVSFILSGETARNGGLYRCEGMVTFPPPFRKGTSAVRILVHVEGHQCQDSGVKTHLSNELLWILIAVLGILCVYSITITIIAGIKRASAWQVNFQNDYINTVGSREP
ncbi:T-cell-specific surface glycoprotein CD28 isoform X2 [Dunckerocampus dactyliophorus]|uniref:T-cell-specific surface glycoprotein CD28 isoform X2 n=1 Tax=Dunckerocampus dactyliophorus TaxID=161453 RepID=UPI002404C36C|nr:T-cell-specific surface glycoprotein CD28 isoform X2 [Dunckerocampus dactyliophorus]